MKTKINLLVDTLIFVGFLAAFEPRMTGENIHEWLGIAFFVTMLVHLILHWKWVVTTSTRFFGKMSLETRISYFVDFLIFLAFLTVNLNGLMISRSALQTFGIRLSGGGSWRQIHSLSAQVTVFLVAIHFALHWNWVVATVKLHIGKPLLGLFRPAKRLEPDPVRIEND
jgi:Cytochrome B561